jgi:HSP20 family molecular chaperone IbpA
MGELTTTNQTELVKRNERVYAPRVDIIESEDHVLLVADMPGVSAESVNIMLEKNVLTIDATVDIVAPEGHDLIHREYRAGGYHRAFTLSDSVDQNQIEAKVNNGVLHLTLPKAEVVKPRRIAIKS